MANSFHRVAHSLRADRALTSTAALAVGLVLASGWLVWALKTPITRYETSESARLEVNGSAYPLQANISGRVTGSSLVLGKEVSAGEILAELDSSAEELNLKEQQAHQASIEPQLAALRAQMTAEEASGLEDHHVLSFSTEGAQAQLREAETQAQLVEQDAARTTQLRAEGVVSETEAQRAKATAQSKRAAVENLRAAILKLAPEAQMRQGDREVRLKQISGNIARLEAEMATSAAVIKRLQYEIERRRIRAPISGRLGECASVRLGSHITEGQQLGVILPGGELQVVAEFQPSAAMGKLVPGQRATLRLDGFPWAQYGTVPASVSRVASEIRDGKVRVELTVDRRAPSRIPFQHGLPGTVEVAVERTTPAALLLRSAGAMVGAR
jgi:multidrug resistance efflux pump